MGYRYSSIVSDFIQIINEPILVIDELGKIHNKNEAAKLLLSNIQIEQFFRLSNSESLDWRYFFKKLKNSNTKIFHHVPILNDLNQINYLDIHIAEIYNMNMYIIRINAITNDHQISNQRTHSFNNLMYLFNEFKQAVVLSDFTGRILAYNALAETVLEFPEIDGPITSFEQLFDQFDYSPTDLINYYKNIGQNYLGELIISHKTLKERTVKVFSMLYKDINILITTFSVNPTNIYRKQDISINFLGENTAKIMHEINNPLTTLKGYIDLMLSKQQFNLEYLHIIKGEINKIESLSSELLFLSNPREDLYKIVSITELIEDCVKVLLIDASKFNCQLDLCIQVEKNSFVFVNEVRIKQVLINIIKNGFEAIYDMQKLGHIKIFLSKENDRYKIAVHDNGPGIDKESLESIFTPFYTTKSTGTGLGLSISKQLIEEHNGELDVESSLNVGTTFIIYLPVYTLVQTEEKSLING